MKSLLYSNLSRSCRWMFVVMLLIFACSQVLQAQEKTSKKKKSKKNKTEASADTTKPQAKGSEKPKMDKKSYKQIKKELREYYYDIEKFEKLKVDMADAKIKADSLNEVLANMKRSEDENTELVERIRAERMKNQETLQTLENQAKLPAERKAIPSEGVFFTIQIGAYNKMNISTLINETAADLSVEVDESGLKRYLLGGYRNYDDAAAARKKIRQLGVKDAWIVSYKDGKRVPMTEVRTTPIPDEELKELEKNKKQ
jgi:hypothetical protein